MTMTLDDAGGSRKVKLKIRIPPPKSAKMKTNCNSVEVEDPILLELILLTESYDQLESKFHENPCNNDLLQHLMLCQTKLDDIICLESPVTDMSCNILMAIFQLRENMKKQAGLIQKKLSSKNAQIIFRSGDITITRLNSSLTHNMEPCMNRVVKMSNLPSPESQISAVINNTKTTPKISGFSDVAGLFDVKKQLRTMIILPIFQPQLFNHFNTGNCVLLFGPPGTGKTLLAHALAAEASATFYCISASDILSSYIGQSEKTLKSIFEDIAKEKTSSILFIDEIDGMCTHRNETESQHCRRLKTEFMCQLSNFESCTHSFLICATNCPWDLDTAFLRRFNKKIYVPLPDRTDRYEFLKLFTKNTPLEQTCQHWGSILSQTKGYSGSDIANLVRHALNIPISELLDTNMWQPVDDNFYEPAKKCNNLTAEIIYCTLSELPKNSVKARSPELFDMLDAITSVRKTISDAEVTKYENYLNKY